jgi:tripartite-type tricarboxylate transporter receptor subunit TctC
LSFRPKGEIFLKAFAFVRDEEPKGRYLASFVFLREKFFFNLQARRYFMVKALVTLLSLGLPFWLGQNVIAQNYPRQPISLIIPLAPGDATDVAGRAIGDELAKLLKVSVVPVNRPGAGGTIGTESTVRAPKDGYTILITNNASLVYNRILTPESVPYDPFKDLTALGLVARTPILLTVRGEAPYKTFAEMVEFAKKNPGGIRIGTVGVGSVGHFTVEIIKSLTGFDVTMVPFKGAGPGVTAALGGHIEGVAVAQGVAAPHHQKRHHARDSNFEQRPRIPANSDASSAWL